MGRPRRMPLEPLLRFGRCSALLLLLAGAPPALAFEAAEVSAIVGNVKRPSDFPGSGGVWMARQRKVDLDGEGNAVITEHLLARVFEAEWGEARFSPYERTYWNEFTSLRVPRARVWHSRQSFEDLPADAIRDEESPAAEGVSSYRYLRRASIRFPRLEPGDVVEIFLAWTCRTPPYDRNTRWSEETFGAEDPVIEQQFVWITPAAAEVDTGVVGRPLPGHIGYFEGRRTVAWHTGNLSPIRGRPQEHPWARTLSPGDTLGDRISSALVTVFADWKSSSEWYGAQWEEGWTQRSPEIDRLASGILARVSDPAARARALEEAVQDGIRTLAIREINLGLRPIPAGQLMLEKAGSPRDKACLLVALLRVAGIEASPVLVRARPDSVVSRVPSLSQLDRFLVRARLLSGEHLWLDPIRTEAALPPGRGLLFVGDYDPPALRAEAGLVSFPGLVPRED